MRLSFDDKEILTKASKVFSTRVLGYIAGFAFTWIVANRYGPRYQGVFSIGLVFLSVGTILAKLGIDTSLVKWIASSTVPSDQKFFFRRSVLTTLISSLTVGLIIFFCAPLIAQMYNKPDIVSTLRWISLGIPGLSLLEICGSIFKGKKETTTFGIYVHVLKFLFPLLLMAVFYGYGLRLIQAPAIAYAAGIVLAMLIALVHLWQRFSLIQAKKLEFFKLNFILKESYPMMVSSSVVMLMGWSDIFLLGFFTSEENIGIYSTAVKLAAVVSFVYNAIATITSPKIAAFYAKKEHKKLASAVSFASKLMVVCGVPIFLVLILFPEFFLSFFGPEYTKGSTILRILVLAQLTNVLTGPVGPMFQMTGRQQVLQRFILISLSINIVLSLVLVGFYNAIGVAVASAVGMMFWNILGAYYLYKTTAIKTWGNLF